MAKFLFLISIMFLIYHLSEQSIYYPPGIVPIFSQPDMVKFKELLNALSCCSRIEYISHYKYVGHGKVKGGKKNLVWGTGGVEAPTKLKTLYETHDAKYVIDNQNHKEFDARKRWPKCKTIGEVHNDGNTRWSWAYAAAGVLADRMCIATNGSYNQLLSTEELISCGGITSLKDGNVPDDGSIWEYLKSHGLVSGGKYNTNEGCQPSKIPPIRNIPTDSYKPTCDGQCYGNKTINYNHDHVKVSHHYRTISKDIQNEVQTYGPVSVLFSLYDDFFLYKSGVYARNEKSKYVRWQYAKLIGWGVEDGVDYWLLVNSWGFDWGQNGLFKIKRGTNECYVETYAYAGEPETKRH